MLRIVNADYRESCFGCYAQSRNDKTWTNFSYKDGTWAKFSTLGLCVPVNVVQLHYCDQPLEVK